MRDTKRRKRWVMGGVPILAAALVAIMLLPGCAGPPPEGQQIIINYGAEGGFNLGNGLDPHTSIGAAATPVVQALFEGLTRKEVGTNELKACLATDWGIAPNWSHADFTIREGITFSNGEAMTAEDVKFSFERAMREDLNFISGGEMRRCIDSIDIIDGYQVRINLKEPWPAMLDRCSLGIMIVPKDYIEENGDDYFADHPVGTGPFTLISYATDDHVYMKAIEDHWRQSPDFDELRITFVPEAATRFSMLKVGDMDIAWVGPAYIPEVEEDPNLRNIKADQCYVHTIVFHDIKLDEEGNSTYPDSPWQDPKVRQAASLAIDREGICETGHGILTPFGGFVAPYQPGYRERPVPEYNPQEAIRLLCEVAGVPANSTAPFDWEDWEWGDFSWEPAVRLGYGPALSQLWEVGIKVNSNEMEFGAWATAHTQGTLCGIGYGPGPWWAGYSHPASSMESHTCGMWAPVGRTFPQLHEAYDELLHAATNEEIALKTQALEDVMFEVGYRIPLWYVNNMWAVGPKVEWFEPVPGNNYLLGWEYLRVKE